MTRDEVEAILRKKPEELTQKDVRTLEHIAYMVDYDPEYLDTLPEERPTEYLDISVMGSPIVRRFRVI